MRENGVTLKVRIAVGSPAEEIVKLAGRESVDLIITGCRGLSGVKELLYGSVSRAVANRAKCPVIIAK